MEQACIAHQKGEVPVGAVIIHGENVLARAHNQPLALHDPSAHAEILALREAGQAQGNYRLLDATLYVTLEPCVMCFGAMIHARIRRLVFGAYDPKAGVLGGACTLPSLSLFNHSLEYQGGVLADQCGALLRDFFAQKRSL